jgi:hypothetical protein
LLGTGHVSEINSCACSIAQVDDFNIANLCSDCRAIERGVQDIGTITTIKHVEALEGSRLSTCVAHDRCIEDIVARGTGQDVLINSECTNCTGTNPYTACLS